MTFAKTCDAGANRNCGPSGNSNCCDVSVVPGGTHKRSYDGVYYTDAGNPATLSTYNLGLYEVTVGRFRRFLEVYDAWRAAGNPVLDAGAHPTIADSGWQTSWPLAADAATLAAGLKCSPAGSTSGGPMQTWTDAAGANERAPINCLTWYEAAAFCAYEGGRLPTNAEWDRAAAGGDQQRIFPWSSPPTDETLNDSLASWRCSYDGTNTGCELSDFAPAGMTTGAGRYGHRDLSGNVWEFTMDYWGTTLPNPCNDCTEPTPSQFRTHRGGGVASFGEGASLRVGRRSFQLTTNRDYGVGMRCVQN